MFKLVQQIARVGICTEAPPDIAGVEPQACEIHDEILTILGHYKREVLVAIALNGVPIDVLADRLNTPRGALYKTVHDARRKLRTHLADAGLRFAAEPKEASR